MPEPAQPPTLRVVQCNILHAGRPYEIHGTQLRVERSGRWRSLENHFTVQEYSTPATGNPGERFAACLRRFSRTPEIIGMQEVVDEGDAARLRELMGEGWRSTTPLGGHGSACIFWNAEAVEPAGEAVAAEIDRYHGIVIRAQKQVFTHRASGAELALTTGKAWYQGSPADRVRRAEATCEFARTDHRSGDEHDNAVIAIDMSPPGSPAYDAMRPFVAKGERPTCPTGIFAGRPRLDADGQPCGETTPQRLDHVFYWSRKIRFPRSQASGIARHGTGPDFGSDHRYVWADVKVL